MKASIAWAFTLVQTNLFPKGLAEFPGAGLGQIEVNTFPRSPIRAWVLGLAARAT
jgi:hypothetical protein